MSRILHQALASEWSQEMYIPVEIVNKIALWIAKQIIPNADESQGHFEETAGVLYDRAMQVCHIIKLVICVIISQSLGWQRIT